MIKNIILDMGNVLLRYEPEIPLQVFFESEFDRNIVRKELFQSETWKQADYGYIKNIDRFDIVSKRIPSRLHKSLKECIMHWYDYLTEIPGARAFIENGKESGYGIYVLSNACSAFYDYFPKFMPLSFFDGIVVSSDIHHIKPEKEIYDYLLHTYKLEPQECLFLDDMMENVEGARRCDIQAVQFLGDFSVANQLLKSFRR